MDTLELLLHPVRLRIAHSLAGGRILTTSQLRTRMPDVSKATLYRQVAVLTEGGVLEVEGEQKVGGIVERRYRLRQTRAVMDAETAASATLEDFRHAFAVTMAALLGEFNAYLDRGHADPVADSIAFFQLSVWLSARERDELINELRRVIEPRLKYRPAPGRRQHLLNPVLFPIEDPPQQNATE